MNKRILFVDDEQHILNGMRDSLSQYDKCWDMTFVCGGEAALESLKQHGYDVLVTDLSMPEVSGDEVLRFTQEQYPATVRIVLSGFSELENTINVTSLSHRYLKKTSDHQELICVLLRSVELAGRFNNPKIIELAGNAGALPVSESSQYALLEKIDNEDSSIDEIAVIIQADISLTAKLLHLVNSAFFRRSRTISSAKEAVAYLGVDLVKLLVLAEQFFSCVDSSKIDKSFSVEALQLHSIVVASIAKTLLTDKVQADVAFTAGLLHDVGKLIMAVERPDYLIEIENLRAEGTWSIEHIENDIIGATHAELGAYFLSLWGIPGPVIEAVAFHHRPHDLGDAAFDAVGAVHVANYLARVCDGNYPEHTADFGLDREYLAALGLLDKLDEWLIDAKEISDMFGASAASVKSKNAA